MRKVGDTFTFSAYSGDTLLHDLTLMRKEDIKEFIQNIFIDPYDVELDEHENKVILETLLSLKKTCNLLHKDLELCILSKLPIHYVYGKNKNFCRHLMKQNSLFILPCVEKQIKLFKKIAQIPNKKNQTALQYIHDRYAHDQQHITNVSKFFDPAQIQQDWENFIENPSAASEDNVARLIYEQHISMLEKK